MCNVFNLYIVTDPNELLLLLNDVLVYTHTHTHTHTPQNKEMIAKASKLEQSVQLCIATDLNELLLLLNDVLILADLVL